MNITTEAIETATDAIMTRAKNPNFTRAQARLSALYAAHNPAGTRHTRWLGPKAKARGLRGATWTAEQVAEMITDGGAQVLYVSFGHVNGMEGFSGSTIVRTETGISVINQDGNVSVGYPFGQGRTLRLLVK